MLSGSNPYPYAIRVQGSNPYAKKQGNVFHLELLLIKAIKDVSWEILFKGKSRAVVLFRVGLRWLGANVV